MINDYIYLMQKNPYLVVTFLFTVSNFKFCKLASYGLILLNKYQSLLRTFGFNFYFVIN